MLDRNNYKDVCEYCEGKKVVPSEFGEKILELIEHNMRFGRVRES